MRKISTWLLSAAVVAACVYGIYKSDHCARFEAQLAAYRDKAFYQAVGAMNDIEIELEKMLLAGSGETVQKMSEKIWRQSYMLGDSISNLSFNPENREHLIEFANKVGEYTLSLNGKDALDQGDEQTLQALLELCAGMNETLDQIFSASSRGDYTLAEPLTNQGDYALDGVVSTDIEYPTMIYDGPFSDSESGEPKVKLGQQIAVQDAMRMALSFIGASNVSNIYEDGENLGDIPTWGFRAELKNGNIVYLHVTKAGGHVLWLLQENTAEGAKVDMQTAAQTAQAFLEDHYPDMTLVYSEQNGNTGVFSFVWTQEEYLVYSDMIKIQVSLANGEIVGFDAGNYLRNHRERQIEEAVLTAEQAAQRVPRLETSKISLCMVPLYEKEYACYELIGVYRDSTYYVYVDTRSGEIINLFKQIETGAVV